MLSTAFIILVIMFIALLLYKIFTIYKLHREISDEENSLDNAIISIEDLSNLEDDEFFSFSKILLKNLGFIDIVYHKNSIIYEKYITASKSGIHYNIFPSKFITLSILTRIIGSIFLHKYKNSIIITSDILTKKALKYVKTLPGDITIDVIDGNKIITTISKYKDDEINFYKNLYKS